MGVMSAAQVKSLLIIASQLSGYSIPANVPAPVIQLVSRVQMAQDACGAETILEVENCDVLGTTDKDGAIEIDFDSTTAEGAGKSLNTVSVHELTHWLQLHHGLSIDTMCPRRFLIEYEAYETEVKYQVTYEHHPIPDAVLIPMTYCPTQEQK